MDQLDNWNEWNPILMPLTPSGLLPRNGPRREVAGAVADMMAPKRALSPRFLEKVEIESQLWDAIRNDMAKARPSAVAHGARRLGEVDQDIVQAVSRSAFATFLRRSVKGVVLSDQVSLSYLYYEERDWVPLHVDGLGRFEYSCLVCVDRKRVAGRPSATYFLLGRTEVAAFDLSAGEAVWFHGRYLPHGRTPLGPGEMVALLNVGFSAARTSSTETSGLVDVAPTRPMVGEMPGSSSKW
ncbi:hypothetical protein [Microtetraspora malaysiensis]|uniref:hypothetical protein n=1 Tax=Microtetraspora malaysiensis TaxID=161358 RepID=UPI003D8AA2F4